MDTARRHLIEELAKNAINTLRVRALCRDFPGIIATSGLRVRIWALLLLGPDYRPDVDGAHDIALPEVPCEEQHVLEADVRRTRSDVEEFRSTTWRMTVHILLQHFCVSHSIPYKQGMNEVLAPFIYLQPPPKGSALPLALYDAFLFRYLERFLCLDDSSFLYKAFRLFHVLLLYHDPQLALHLKDQEFPPELYSPQWFVTLFSRSLPLLHTLRLWDMLIAVDDPAFTFFIGLLLLRTKRDELLRSDCDTIPEIIQNLGFGGEESIDEVVSGAVELYKATPRSMCRLLRLCCVSTTQLAVTPSQRSSTQLQTAGAADSTKMAGVSTGTRLTVPSSLEKAMAVQAARSSVMLNVKELVESLQSARSEKTVLGPEKATDGTKSGDGGNKSDTPAGDTNNDKSVSGDSDVKEQEQDKVSECTGIWGGISGGGAGSGLLKEQFVIIDVRPSALVNKSGAGRIACAMNIDEEFLDQPDAFHAWLQHFDAARGCSVCIVDIPPVASSGLSLWRRLILGEGDGDSSTAAIYGSNSGAGPMGLGMVGRLLSGKNKKDTAGKKDDATNNRGGNGSGAAEVGSVSNSSRREIKSDSQFTQRDLQSKYNEAENAAVCEDNVRPAMRLAVALQRQGFPRVSVLDGGFPALVDHLVSLTGSVEPIILNHESAKWEAFLKSTGRSAARSVQSPPASAGTSGVADVMLTGDYHGLGINVATVEDHRTQSSSKRLQSILGAGKSAASSASSSSSLSSHSNIDANHKQKSGQTLSARGFMGGGIRMVSAGKKREQMNDLEVAQLALNVAERLGHKYMASKLKEKIKQTLMRDPFEADFDNDDVDNGDGDTDVDGEGEGDASIRSPSRCDNQNQSIDQHPGPVRSEVEVN